MSQFANYSDDARHYDATRVPIGLELTLGCLSLSGPPLQRQSVLDAGCGTGNYLGALSGFVGSLTGVDSSQAMLEEARGKLGDDVALIRSDIRELPLADAAVDGVVCSQVLHHLEQGPLAEDDPADWPPGSFDGTAAFLAEARRVLRPRGTLILNFCQPQQVREGFWWASLIPAAVDRLARRLPTLEQLSQILDAAGLKVVLAAVDLHNVLQGHAYFDPLGPLSESWRAGDSTWGLASEAELDAAQRRVEHLRRAGLMGGYLEAREARRRHVGQTTFVCARKDSDET